MPEHAPGAMFATAVGEMLLAFGMSRDRFDTARMQTYWQHLKDIPGPVLLAAARELIKASHRFPTVAEWRRACDEVDHGLFYNGERPQLTEGDAPPPPAPDDWAAADTTGPWCPTCKDTGFVPRVCRQGDRCNVTRWLCSAFDRDRPEHTHTYVTFCQCREINPAIARRVEETRKMQHTAKYGHKIEGVQ
jgi:hypothetical protein